MMFISFIRTQIANLTDICVFLLFCPHDEQNTQLQISDFLYGVFFFFSTCHKLFDGC